MLRAWLASIGQQRSRSNLRDSTRCVFHAAVDKVSRLARGPTATIFAAMSGGVFSAYALRLQTTRVVDIPTSETGVQRVQPSIRPIDDAAASMPWMAGLSQCLYVPVAAKGRAAIEQYVGSVTEHRSAARGNALVVAAYLTPTIDTRLPVWNLPEAVQLHAPIQVWVSCAIVNRSSRRDEVSAAENRV